MTEARTQFTNQLGLVTEQDLRKKLGGSPNLVGFLIRHTGEVELLFAKTIFEDSTIKATAKTIIDQYNTGEWTDLESLINYVSDSFEKLKAIVEQQTDEDWETTVSIMEFGTKTKAEALGRIISHNAYHARQIAIIKNTGYEIYNNT